MPQYLKDLGKAFGIKILLLICLGLFFWGYKKYYPCDKVDIKKIYTTGLLDGFKRG
jgi:hypothetical protein